MLLLVLCGALFLDGLDVSMVGVALPSIRADLSMSNASLQWVVSAYVLGYGGFLLLGGRVADIVGRRHTFLVSLAVFVVASGLGGVATGAATLIASRFVKGVSAAFTAPAGLSIITTTFDEGPVRNRALAIYTATGASGFSLGLVIGGGLTQIAWRWTFFLPVMVAAATLLAAARHVPRDQRSTDGGPFDAAGALALTTAMLLAVFAVVEVPQGHPVLTWAAGAAAAIGFVAFVIRERRAAHPLVRLGILRSADLVRANLGAASLFGAWVGFLFIATLYLQQLRGWSAIETGAAVFPSGVVVVALASQIGRLVGRFSTTPLITAGLTSAVAAYALFLRIDENTAYLSGILPTVLLGGLGFALAFGPLNMAATNGIVPAEQGLAGGLVNTSFQFGGALVLAVVTAVDNAATHGSSSAALLSGFRAGIAVTLVTAALGVIATNVKEHSWT
ncbi:MFS transporter [Frankia sp. R82]|uniref:MFS transporter n=1 Tax=Frankia sp. R82 TaxID=2950553 RepID=UPI0020430AEB|nr:MFS transporter [Frankia sp. R82]MCM3885542.1 MFS transporter [Frankia sp. R82]